ncbi:MAG TPA: DUF4270 family protein [Sunxiuqinia sp.]|nr:DUF4270 family protein [Sunxiuqinia sp.]
MFTLLTFLLWNCKDNPNSTGMGLLPVSDVKKVGQNVEKESIKAYTKHDVLIRTDEPNNSVFGTFDDPVFGKTTGSVAFQVQLPYFPPYTANSHADSLILNLYYKGVYGDTITPQSLKVYELQDNLYLDTLTSSGSSVEYSYYQDVDLKGMSKPNPIGELGFTPKFRMDSTATDTVDQTLSIKLSSELADRLIHADSLDMDGPDAFVNFFKGVFVESQDMSSGGGLLNMVGASMTMYYSNVTDTATTDSLVYNYQVNSNTARVSRYTHDYSMTTFGAKLNDESTADSLIYLQTLGGLRAKIEVPSLNNWADSIKNDNIIINKAKLIFQVDTVASDYHDYALPKLLALLVIDDQNPDSKGLLPLDYAVSPSLYGGTYNSTDATFSFIITHQLQSIIEDPSTNTGFYLSTTFQNEKARRVVLKGSSSHVGIRLEVTYTKLN